MPFPALDLDITFELMSGVVALLASYYAFRYNKLLENSTLKFISLGFVMLGIGLLIEAAVFSLIVFGIGDLTTDRTFALGTAALYGILQVGAFFLFAFGYLKGALSAQPKIESASRVALALFAFPLITSGSFRLRQMFEFTHKISAIAGFCSVIFLAMVIFVGYLSYSETRSRISLFVIVSFALILVAQLFDLWTALSISVRLDILASAIRFAGFLTLLTFLVSSGKNRSIPKDPAV